MSAIHVGDIFFDSNVLLYIHDRSNSAKIEMAGRWLVQASLYVGDLTIINPFLHKPDDVIRSST